MKIELTEKEIWTISKCLMFECKSLEFLRGFGSPTEHENELHELYIKFGKIYINIGVQEDREIDLCDKCKKEDAHHFSYSANGNTQLCCKCHIDEGGIPADWHAGCMKYHKVREEK